MAEQVHRAKALSAARAQYGGWLKLVEHRIKLANLPNEMVQETFSRLKVRPVFTAHPTEATRRTILVKLRFIANLLELPESTTRQQRLAETIDLLWQTDELRLEKPEVLDEEQVVKKKAGRPKQEKPENIEPKERQKPGPKPKEKLENIEPKEQKREEENQIQML
jgi:phosphoenolpyruvate carboxylase